MTDERRDGLFKQLLKPHKVPKEETTPPDETSGAIVLKPDSSLQAPVLNTASILAETDKLGFLDRWRLGHQYSEAQRAQLKEVLATQNRLVADKLAIIEKQSMTHRLQTVALMVEFTVAQAEEGLRNIRAQADIQRNKHLNEMTLRYVDDVIEIEQNPKLPVDLRDIRLKQLTDDFFQAVDDVRSKAVLKKHGLDSP